ncbi:uncharacterized protein LOC123512754 [Portunus trituberculatus]|uniref:uncharacterized protein LOC123512754 n=1 Tax=Portunus trituberculatus TaxID=210409 RepID=UPI001E1CECD3|nr:uncharacterized protein LOC123512754 [Portunus trituberculatus]
MERIKSGAGVLAISSSTVLPHPSVPGVLPPTSPGSVTSGARPRFPLLLPSPTNLHFRRTRRSGKCPRCLQPGVNVWHGCARRQTQPRGIDSVPPPPLSTRVPPTPPLPRRMLLSERLLLLSRRGAQRLRTALPLLTQGLTNSPTLMLLLHPGALLCLNLRKPPSLQFPRLLRGWTSLALVLTTCVNYFPVRASLPRVVPLPTLSSLLHPSTVFVIDSQLKLLS